MYQCTKKLFLYLAAIKNGWVNYHECWINCICIIFNVCFSLHTHNLTSSSKASFSSLIWDTVLPHINILYVWISNIFCKILTWVKHFFLRYNKMKWCGISLGEAQDFISSIQIKYLDFLNEGIACASIKSVVW